MKRGFWMALWMICLIALQVVPAGAAIYMDEDFEGDFYLVDRNFPVRDNDITVPSAPLVQGLNLRAWDASYTFPAVAMALAEGSVTTDRSRSGSRSYRLQSGQRLSSVPGQLPYADGDGTRLFQFAVSVDSATAALPANTQVGYYRLDYSTQGKANVVPDVSVTLILRTNASGSVDLVCANNNTVLTTLTGANGDWALVSLLTYKIAGETKTWKAYDPLTSTFKGPPPKLENPFGEADPNANELYSVVQQGITIYIDNPTGDEATRLTAANLGNGWGNASDYSLTSEIGWEFGALNNGTIYLDDLYWDGGLHDQVTRPIDREQAARMSDFAMDMEAETLPSAFDSPIKTIYVIHHSHLDIGFTHVPSALANIYRNMTNTQLTQLRNRPDFKWNVESTWQLEQWLNAGTTTPANVEEFFNFVRQGRISIGAGHSTLHSGKAGFEQVSRLLWNAKRYRDTHGVEIQTLFQNDVPGVNWAYPQILAKAGIKYLISGQNLFIGGGFTQPYRSYPFYWEAPDGSRVLTWSSRTGYTDGFSDYGLPYFSGNTVNLSNLTSSLNSLVSQGYPYDALMVQYAFDNGNSNAAIGAINTWNATYSNPRFVWATPEDFFEYLEGKYGDIIPTHSGNWTSNWDTGQVVEPQSEKIVKNAQSDLLSVEKMWSLADYLGLGVYPHAEFDNAWDMTVTVDEHSGGGGCWPGYWTQAQVDQNNEEHWAYAQSALASHMLTRESAVNTLLGAAAVPESDSILVFNPMSWERTDLVRVALNPTRMAGDFILRDAVNMAELPYQKDLAAGEILFIAPSVPSIGYKRFLLLPGTPTPPAYSLALDSDFIENSRFRITISPQGYITSLYDKLAQRELVNAGASFDFNRTITATNIQYFTGGSEPVPNPASSVVSGNLGPVMASLVIENANHPFARSEIILYEGLDRVDLINTPDRTKMLYAPADINSRYYAFTFPFNLSGYSARIDTAAGWLNPAFDSIPGSYRNAHCIQNAVNLSEAGYGITIATADVYTHAFGTFQGGGAPLFPPNQPTLISTFVRYGDEAELRGGAIGYVDVEPGSNPQWDLTYSIIPHVGAFDSVRESRSAWEANTPMLTREVPAGTDGVLVEPSQSFLAVDQPNVMIVSVKQAAAGKGIIVKLQEVERNPLTAVTLESDFLNFYNVFTMTPLEDEKAMIFNHNAAGGPTQSIDLTMGSMEIKTLRILPQAELGVSGRAWMQYD